MTDYIIYVILALLFAGIVGGFVIMIKSLDEIMALNDLSRFMKSMVKLIIESNNDELMDELQKLYKRSKGRVIKVEQLYPNLATVLDSICYTIQISKAKQRYKLSEEEIKELKNKYSILDEYIEKNKEQLEFKDLHINQQNILIQIKNKMINEDDTTHILDKVYNEFKIINKETKKSEKLSKIGIATTIASIIFTIIITIIQFMMQ